MAGALSGDHSAACWPPRDGRVSTGMGEWRSWDGDLIGLLFVNLDSKPGRGEKLGSPEERGRSVAGRVGGPCKSGLRYHTLPRSHETLLAPVRTSLESRCL